MVNKDPELKEKQSWLYMEHVVGPGRSMMMVQYIIQAIFNVRRLKLCKVWGVVLDRGPMDPKELARGFW